jgi:hypothetical protein
MHEVNELTISKTISELLQKIYKEKKKLFQEWRGSSRFRKENLMEYSDEHIRALVQACVGRVDTYATRHEDGRYHRELTSLTSRAMRAHIEGILSVASYAITEQGGCRFAVFSARGQAGFLQLVDLQQQLAGLGLPVYLEALPVGAHLWLFLQSLCSSALLRAALLPYCPADVRFCPGQDEASWEKPGTLVPLPLGMYSNGRRYPFVEYKEGRMVAYARTPVDLLSWLATVERVEISVLTRLVRTQEQQQDGMRGQVREEDQSNPGWVGIRQWNAQQDPFEVVGRYVQLDHRGIGRCPLEVHHPEGKKGRSSLKVYHPHKSGGYCWYCYTWKRGGSVFDFLKYYHGLTEKELSDRIRKGEQF